MKPLFLTALVLLLVGLPTAHALSPQVSRDRVDLLQDAASVRVSEQLTVTLQDAGAWDKRIHVWVPSVAVNVDVDHVANNLHQAPNHTTGAADAQGLADLVIDVSPFHASPQAGDTFTVLVFYEVPSSRVSLRTFYASASLAVFASPKADQAASSEELGDAIPVNTATVHWTRQPVNANFTYAVTFQATAGTVAARDLTKYVWGGLGVLAGLFLAYVAVRQGWVQPATKAKKFVKGGAVESMGMLEARRRSLLAALKELEQAHESKEVADDVYAPLKEEYKAQAVRVMRSLEEKKDGS